MKILIISHKPPYPIVDGGCLAMARFLEDLLALDAVKQIDYFTLETNKHRFNANTFKQHPKLSVSAHFIDTRVQASGALLALLKQESYNLTRFKKEAVVAKLQTQLEQNDYHAVFFESLFAASYAPILRTFTSAKFIYRAHNIEHQIWKDLAQNTRNPFKKWYLNQLAYSLKWAERSIWSEDQGALDLILTISKTDLHLIESQTLTSCKYLPASLPCETTQSMKALQLCFLGAFNWIPNTEAVDWFLQHVFPSIRQRHPHITFHIAGKGSELKKNWLQEGVVVHGFVEDPKAFLAEHGIFVGCLQAGSGVKMKVIEAMSVGAPMVLSLKSTDGLPDLPEAYIAPTAAAFTQALCRLIEDPQALQKNATFFSNYFAAHFQTASVQRQLQQILEELQNNR